MNGMLPFCVVVDLTHVVLQGLLYTSMYTTTLQEFMRNTNMKIKFWTIDHSYTYDINGQALHVAHYPID